MEERVRMEVGKKPPPPPPQNPSWYLRDQERARQRVRRGSFDSLGDGERGGEEEGKIFKRIVVEEEQEDMAMESKGKRAVSPSLTISDNDETKDADSNASGSSDGGSLESDYPRNGTTRIPADLVSTTALSDLGYAFEIEAAKYLDQVDTIIIFKALGPKNIDEVIKLSENYKGREGFDILPRETVLIEDLCSRSRSPIRRRYNAEAEHRSRICREMMLIERDRVRDTGHYRSSSSLAYYHLDLDE